MRQFATGTSRPIHYTVDRLANKAAPQHAKR
jgi:hypothetical protein